MNTRTLITIAAFATFAVSGSAFAQEATSDAWMNAAATKTRAQVGVELQQARADGSIKAGSAGYFNPIVSQKSRAEVRAEVLAAARSGELSRIDAEAYAFGDRHAPMPAAARLALKSR